MSTHLNGKENNVPENGKLDQNGEPRIKKRAVDFGTELVFFDKIFPELVETLTSKGLKNEEISDGMKWMKEVVEYNTPFGKKNRGLAVVTSYRLLKEESEVSEDELQQAQVLGWCVELLQAFFLVADDIMDRSHTRRGQPCWFRRAGVNLIAINDSFFLECCIYTLLKKYCRSLKYYTEIMELFHETTLQTVMGQCLDLITPPSDGSVDLSRYTPERYAAIVKWKTAYYSFYLPVALAMYMAEVADEELHSSAKSILLEMGHFFQVQDDYLDCFGDPAVLGKIGTDIEENKCSWCMVTALGLCSPEQRLKLQENYGQNDKEKVEVVKAIYRDLDLPAEYTKYEEASFASLMTSIQSFSGDLPKDIFVAFAKKIYKRNA